MPAEPDHTAENRGTYDRIAPLYLSQQLEHRSTGESLFEVLEQRWKASLPPNARLGDLGCGPALDGARFRSEGHQVVGFDLSRGMLAVAAERLSGRLAQADLRALPLRPGCLDGAWCVAALLHVPEDRTRHALAELRAALRLGGVLALVTALGEGVSFEPVPYAPHEGRWFVYRRQPRLERQLRQAGFRILFSDRQAASRLWLTTLAQAI